MTTMVSIDPGNFEGGACWAEWSNGVLMDCGAWPYLSSRPDRVVCETQVIIPRFTKQPASIITLAHKTGAILRDFGWPDRTIVEIKLVKPSSWKGSSPKPRAARLWATYAIHRLVENALSPAELEVYRAVLSYFPDGEKHNLADAVGIGLDDQGRLR